MSRLLRPCSCHDVILFPQRKPQGSHSQYQYGMVLTVRQVPYRTVLYIITIIQQIILRRFVPTDKARRPLLPSMKQNLTRDLRKIPAEYSTRSFLPLSSKFKHLHTELNLLRSRPHATQRHGEPLLAATNSSGPRTAIHSGGV